MYSMEYAGVIFNEIDTCIRSIADRNSLVAMIILGYYLSEIPFLKLLVELIEVHVC